MRIEVDERRCVGAGQCVWVAPRVFDQRPADGVVALRAARPDPDDHPGVREAVVLCPARAIRIVSDDPALGDAVADPRNDPGETR
ncbi:MAG: Ferredoxin-2 [Pseudomonadota bacterium]|jgi:ferredoxin